MTGERGDFDDANSARIQQARDAVLSAVDMLSPGEVAAMLPGTDLGGIAGLLGLPFGDVVRYPTFQFDLDARTVRPVVLAVNQILDPDDDDDGWAVASWWTSPDGRLNGACPITLLGTGSEPRLLDMARAESDDI